MSTLEYTWLVCVCDSACMHECSSGYTIWHPGLKFGMRDLIHPGNVKGQWICSGWTPHPWGQGPPKDGPGIHRAQRVHFWENFIKQKLKNVPNFVAAAQIRSGSRALLGVCQEVQVKGGLLQAWSLGQLGWNLAGRSGTTQEGQCLRWSWEPLSQVSGEPKNRVLGPVQSERCFSWENFTKQKLKGTPKNSGMGQVTQVSGRSKCKGGFWSHGSLAI